MASNDLIFPGDAGEEFADGIDSSARQFSLRSKFENIICSKIQKLRRRLVVVRKTHTQLYNTNHLLREQCISMEWKDYVSGSELRRRTLEGVMRRN